MAEVMCGLPVVESLVAILDGGEEGGNEVGGEEEVESGDGLDGEGVLESSGEKGEESILSVFDSYMEQWIRQACHSGATHFFRACLAAG
jgi:hypothetical protein